MEWTATELPDWRPLEANVPLEERPDYMHMGVCGTIQLYKHRDTRRYLNIDADCVRFYLRRDGGFAEADREAAFLHVHGPAFSDGATNLPVQKPLQSGQQRSFPPSSIFSGVPSASGLVIDRMRRRR